MKEKIINLKTSTLSQRFQSIYKAMLSYCLKCKRNIKSKSPKIAKTKREKPVLLSKCAVYGSKNIKIQIY